jgi:uncharacterized damage-inducible protein DinB
MQPLDLQVAVEDFAQTTAGLPDAALNIEWNWQDYDEGVRFAFFRTYEDLRELAAVQLAQRALHGQPATTAQRILAQNQLAWRDLQAVLLGVSEEQATDIPAEGEWPIKQVLLHITKTERTFFAICLDALQKVRQGRAPDEMTDEEWEAFWAGDAFEQQAENWSLNTMLAYLGDIHLRVLEAFTSASDAELEIPVSFWESQPMPLHFRLHRFDSHMRQHTIQVEKTLGMLSLYPAEARRLLRLVYAALAEAEGAGFGWEAGELEGPQATAQTIRQRTEEIKKALAAAEQKQQD